MPPPGVLNEKVAFLDSPAQTVGSSTIESPLPRQLFTACVALGKRLWESCKLDVLSGLTPFPTERMFNLKQTVTGFLPAGYNCQ